MMRDNSKLREMALRSYYFWQTQESWFIRWIKRDALERAIETARWEDDGGHARP